MIYSAVEREKKQELQNLLDCYKSNIEYCGSKDALKKQYPGGYKKLRHNIGECLNAYLNEAWQGTHVSSKTTVEDIKKLWAPREKEIKIAIEEFSSDKIFDIIITFLSEVVCYFEGSMDLPVLFPDEEVTQ